MGIKAAKRAGVLGVGVLAVLTTLATPANAHVVYEKGFLYRSEILCTYSYSDKMVNRNNRHRSNHHHQRARGRRRSSRPWTAA